MLVYLAGPMRGIEKFNFPAFDEAALKLVAAGHEVFNQAKHDREVYPFMYSWEGFALGDPSQCPEFDLAEALKWDLQRVLEADAVAVLPGWEASIGARLETDLARALGKKVLDAETLRPVEEKQPSISSKLLAAQPAQTPVHAPIPSDSAARKVRPMARGLLDYFPAACAEVAHVSFVGNEQHNKGEPMHWAREKSKDHADCIVRHLVERGTVDTDGLKHSAKLAWRALALLQLECEDERLKELI